MPQLLVVDDDPLIAGMLRMVLESEGYEVSHAEDGRAALQVLADDPPACMVLDMMMPHVDGYGVLEALQQRSAAATTRVVMLTCCSAEEDVRKALTLGADDYLTKPVDVDHLLNTVRDLLSLELDAVEARRHEVEDEGEMVRRIDGVLGRHAQFLAG